MGKGTRQRELIKWLIPAGLLFTLVGYFGPWIGHPVAGLVITGLDMGEYVKFLVTVQSGVVVVWREGFYLPLLATSLISSFYTFEVRLKYGWLMRAVLLSIAIVSALNMLPPAWTPSLLLTPEFQRQTVAILACLLAMALSPFLALVPHGVRSGIALLLLAGALWWPLRDFLRVLPTIRDLYQQPLVPGWGVYLMSLGLILLSVAVLGMTNHATWRNE